MKTLKEIYQNDISEFPTRKWEAWKYIYLEPLLKSKFEEGELGLTSSLPARLPAGKAGQAGGNDEKKSARGDDTNAQDDKSRDEPNPFVAVNAARSKKPTVIHLPQGTKQAQPIHLSFEKSSASQVAACSRVLIQAEAEASAQIIVKIPSGVAKEAFLNFVIEARLGASSKINLVLVEEEEKSAARFVSTRFYLAQNCELYFVTYSEGGVLDRNDTVAHFEGSGALFDLADLAVLSGDLRAYHHAIASHKTGGSKSRQLFKTILAGSAQAEINSLSFVHRNAAKSDSHQINRNLLLSDAARVWSRPQLKIYTDDVQAAHGSATGRLDTNELFYLQSRGLSEAAARTLLMFGFAQEVLEKIQDKELCESLKQRVRERIRSLTQ